VGVAAVVYRAFLPTDIPSSFSGKYIKVAYWLTVCGQQPLHETVSLRVPLRVVNPLGTYHSLLRPAGRHCRHHTSSHLRMWVVCRVYVACGSRAVFKRLGLMEWRSEDRAGVEAESQEVEPVDLSRAFHFVHNHTQPGKPPPLFPHTLRSTIESLIAAAAERGDGSFENEPRRTTEPRCVKTTLSLSPH
jgi:hypothetical protein